MNNGAFLTSSARHFNYSLIEQKGDDLSSTFYLSTSVITSDAIACLTTHQGERCRFYESF
jgi:hypothetical protein